MHRKIGVMHVNKICCFVFLLSVAFSNFRTNLDVVVLASLFIYLFSLRFFHSFSCFSIFNSFDMILPIKEL